MRQTLKHIRLLAAHMGITAHELHRRRALKSQAEAVSDEIGTVTLRPRVHCRRELRGWRLIPRTVIS